MIAQKLLRKSVKIMKFEGAQVAPMDLRRPVPGTLGASGGLPATRLPSPPRPVKHPRDDSAASEKDEGRPRKHMRTEAGRLAVALLGPPSLPVPPALPKKASVLLPR